MTVDEGLRTEVYAALRTAHGEKVANALMEMLPPAGVPELATKADLAVLESRLMGEIAGVKAEVSVLRSEFGERIEKALREQTSRLIGWMLATAGVILGVVGAFAGLG